MSYSGSGNGSGAVSTGSDVALSSPLQAQYLGFNASIQKWQNYARPQQLIESVYTTIVTSSAQTISDVTVATISNLTLSANCTFTFPAVAAGKSFMIALKQDSTGGRIITWPNNILWAGSSAPTLTTTASKTDVISFICVDGVNWLGFVAGKGF